MWVVDNFDELHYSIHCFEDSVVFSSIHSLIKMFKGLLLMFTSFLSWVRKSNLGLIRVKYDQLGNCD